MNSSGEILMRVTIKYWLLCLPLMLLAVPMLVAAQEDTIAAGESASQMPESGGTIMLLVGIAMVGLVSLIWYLRERSANGDETNTLK
jgi:hypothetical protein